VHEAVSDVLVDRSRGADGILSRMVLLSFIAHAMLIATVLVMPAEWRSTSVLPKATPMVITLSGGDGPDAGGITPIAGKPVQAVAPADARPTPAAPPAPKAPDMVAPTVTKVAPKTPPKSVDKPVDKSSARKPATGAEVKPGDAKVDTGGAPIPFGGLTRPSGGGPPSGVTLDVQNFCCPEYLIQMRTLIMQNWNQNQGASGKAQVKFTIQRDGTLTDVALELPSGAALLDLESQRALLKTRQLPALPREFTNPTLTVHLIFEYHR
jgi:TonB family protein